MSCQRQSHRIELLMEYNGKGLVDSVKLKAVYLIFGAPLGPIMGPEDSKIYTLQIIYISRGNSLELYGCANDSNIYIAFNLNDPNDLQNSCWMIERQRFAMEERVKYQIATLTFCAIHGIKLDDLPQMLLGFDQR